MDKELRQLIGDTIERTVENVGSAAQSENRAEQGILLDKFTNQIRADVAAIDKAIIALLANMKPTRTKYIKERKWLR